MEEPRAAIDGRCSRFLDELDQCVTIDPERRAPIGALDHLKTDHALVEGDGALKLGDDEADRAEASTDVDGGWGAQGGLSRGGTRRGAHLYQREGPAAHSARGIPPPERERRAD